MAFSDEFRGLKKTHYRPTDGWTDRRTDTASYRDARTHLKTTIIEIMNNVTCSVICVTIIISLAYRSIWWIALKIWSTRWILQ